MKIFQFIDEYCQDLVQAHQRKSELVDFSDFFNDGIMYDDAGNAVPYIIVDTQRVPIQDIITSERADFVAAYNLPHAGEAYDDYVRNLVILEGPDVIDRVRNAIASEVHRLTEVTPIVDGI